MNKNTYEPSPGTDINSAVREAHAIAVEKTEAVVFDFNGREISVYPVQTEQENILGARKAMGLPAVDPPFHPVTAEDALKRWDDGRTVFTIEMGGLGPAYEQAIQILVFEMIRDNLAFKLPSESDPDFNAKLKDFGYAAVSRIDGQMGGYSGAMVGAAQNLAYRALRDGWGEMIRTAPQDRLIQVCNRIPSLAPK